MSNTRKHSVKYTKEMLEPIIKESITMTQVVRKLGYAIAKGNIITYLTAKIKRYGIDTSHFVGQSFNRGRRINCDDWQNILVNGKNRRESAKRLRRALQDSGVSYKCVSCDNDGIWNSKKLVLEIDHINQDPSDDRKENLQFLCPNCHSQKPVLRACGVMVNTHV